MAWATIRVDVATRDALVRMAAERKTSIGEVLDTLLWEHERQTWREPEQLADRNATNETEYLLGNPAMADHLRKGIAEANAGGGREHER